MKWTFNGNEIKNDGQLLINSFNIQNEGHYECIASNNYGMDKKSMMLSSSEKMNSFKPVISIQVLSNPLKDHVANGQVKLKCISGNYYQKTFDNNCILYIAYFKNRHPKCYLQLDSFKYHFKIRKC